MRVGVTRKIEIQTDSVTIHSSSCTSALHHWLRPEPGNQSALRDCASAISNNCPQSTQKPSLVTFLSEQLIFAQLPYPEGYVLCETGAKQIRCGNAPNKSKYQTTRPPRPHRLPNDKCSAGQTTREASQASTTYPLAVLSTSPASQ